MRITIATGPCFPVPPVQGGAMSRVWQGLAEEFAARGHDTVIFARAFEGQPQAETIGGVRYLRYGGFTQRLSVTTNLIRDCFYAIGAVRRLPSADVLVINDFWLPFFAGWRQGRVGKVVISANRFPKGQCFLYHRAARIAAASNSIARAIRQQTPSIASRVRVLPNPVNTTVFVPPLPPRGDSPQKTLLYVGRLHPEKGVHVLVEAFNRFHKGHPGVRLRLVGPIAEHQGGGGEGYLRLLKQLATASPVEIANPVFDLNKLAEVYRQADLFCYPSLADKGEALPVAPLEAMATGMSPVVSKLDCFLDLIADGKTGFYFDHRQSDSAQALAMKLEEALGTWSQTLSMGQRASKVAQRFSYPRVAQMFLEDFMELLDGSKPSTFV